MKGYRKISCLICVCGLIIFVNVGYAATKAAGSNPQKPVDKVKEEKAVKVAAQSKDQWQDIFTVDKKNLVNIGENKYFILIPGYRMNYIDGNDILTITVLDETKLVDGVKTRIVEERETANGQLAEISRNYFAIDKTDKAVYYFGETVDIYKDGKVTGHEGGWQSGEKGNRFGLMMPGKPKVGDKYYQEFAPGVAMDRAEIISVSKKMKVPAGTFENCVVTKEGSAIEKGTGTKVYAPGTGMIKDDGFILVKVDRPKAEDVKKEEKPSEKQK